MEVAGVSRRKKTKNNWYDQLLLSIVLILFLSAVGISYASWGIPLSVTGQFATGFIAPIFYEPVLSTNGCRGDGEVISSQCGQMLYVYLHNAFPGDVYWLDFQIKNGGTVPVKTETILYTSGEALELDLLREPEGTIEVGEMKRGQVRIKVCAVAANCHSVFGLHLSVRQSTVF